MLFRRRDQPSLRDRLRLWLWPRVSWRRSALYYLKRTLRLSGTPYGIAMGSAVGAFISFTPFLGLHLVLAFALAWFLRGNVIAAALGTCIGNPVTFPFIWAGSYEIGRLLMGDASPDAPAGLEHELVHRSWDQLWPVLEPMILGSLPIGSVAACIVFAVVYKAVAAYQGARRERFAGRARTRPVETEESAALAGSGGAR